MKREVLTLNTNKETKTMIKSWSDEEDAIVKDLADKGWFAEDIANELFKKGFKHRTKNSIIGRCHRKGFKLHNAHKGGQRKYFVENIWSTEELNILNELAAKGENLKGIHLALKSFGKTASAIKNKASKLGLTITRSFLGSKFRRTATGKFNMVIEPVVVKHRIRLSVKEPKSDPFTRKPDDISDIPDDHHCKFIYGDVKLGNASWCRQRVHSYINKKGEKTELSFCPEHAKRCYRNPESLGLE